MYLTINIMILNDPLLSSRISFNETPLFPILRAVEVSHQCVGKKRMN